MIMRSIKSNYFDSDNHKEIKIFNHSCAYNGCNRKGIYYSKIIYVNKSAFFCQEHYDDLDLNGLIVKESESQILRSSKPVDNDLIKENN